LAASVPAAAQLSRSQRARHPRTLARHQREAERGDAKLPVSRRLVAVSVSSKAALQGVFLPTTARLIKSATSRSTFRFRQRIALIDTVYSARHGNFPPSWNGVTSDIARSNITRLELTFGTVDERPPKVCQESTRIFVALRATAGRIAKMKLAQSTRVLEE